MSDQLADVFTKVNYGEHDTQDAQGVAEAIVEARNTSRELLTEAAAEIAALCVRVEELQAAIDAAKEQG
jgi:16S rRNA C1402 N4-methylase RsmH